MRQNKNIKYAKKCTKSLKWNNFIFRFQFLKNVFFTNIIVNIFNDPWKTTTFTIPRNELQNAINQQMTNINSIESKQKCYIVMAINTYQKKSM
jgi:hypothetical protein